MDSLEYEPIEPLRTERVNCFQSRTDGSQTFGPLDMHVYPDSPEGVALREHRRGLGLYHYDAAHALSLGLAAYSALERGGARCNWARATALLTSYAETLDRLQRDPRAQV